MSKNKIYKSISILSLISIALYIKNKLDIKKSKKEFPSLGNIINIKGKEIHYLEEGNGETIIFLHDNSGDIYDFYLSEIWNKLKSKYRLIAIDRPGFGYSDNFDEDEYKVINKIIETLNINEYTLFCIGNSAILGYYIISENNKDIKKAIFIDDKLELDNNIFSKILNTPYIGKFFAWTFLPIILKGDLKLSYSISDELINKYKYLDNQPNKIINRAKNKYFLSIKKLLDNLKEKDKIETPIKIIKFQDKSLFQELELEKYFNIYKYIQIKSLSNLDILNSNEIYDLL